MKRVGGGWRLLIALLGAATFLGVLAAGIVLSGRSLVILDNRSPATLALAVRSTTPGDFDWSGDLKPGRRVYRLARFTTDGGLRASCTDAEGVYRATGGYVTSGWPYRVDVVAAGCGAIRIDADRLP
ncbi:hypothetical protein [Brevundimonas sp. FT23028]|uniref:hypothetical protein n=1 Tax=Brevundimonas sp. FT23028 TaxID=3393748 RepID=UPI003B58A1BA